VRWAGGAAALLGVVCVSGCAGQTVPAAVPAHANGVHPYVKHIVIVVQENRSLDNLFSGFPGADAPKFGYAGTERIALHATPLEDPGNVENNWRDAIAGWDHGKMNGFEREHFYGGPLDYAYAFVPRSESAPYWAMARQYVLADRMFPTEFGPSYTAHLSLIAANTTFKPGPVAQVDAPDQFPWGCDAPPGTRTFTIDVARTERFNGPFPCFDKFRTVADTLDSSGGPVEILCRAAKSNRWPGLVGV
jgi:phospholipase C